MENIVAIRQGQGGHTESGCTTGADLDVNVMGFMEWTETLVRVGASEVNLCGPLEIDPLVAFRIKYLSKKWTLPCTYEYRPQAEIPAGLVRSRNSVFFAADMRYSLA